MTDINGSQSATWIAYRGIFLRMSSTVDFVSIRYTQSEPNEYGSIDESGKNGVREWRGVYRWLIDGHPSYTSSLPIGVGASINPFWAPRSGLVNSPVSMKQTVDRRLHFTD